MPFWIQGKENVNKAMKRKELRVIVWINICNSASNSIIIPSAA